MADEGALLIVGYYGASQTTECARYSDSVEVPYLAPGSEHRVQGALDTAYLATPSYVEQARILAQYAANGLGTEADRYGQSLVPALDAYAEGLLPRDAGPDGRMSVGLVIHDRGWYDGFDEALREELRRQGHDLDHVSFVGHFGSDGLFGRSASDTVNELRYAGIDVVVLVLEPSDVLSLVGDADDQGYRPVYLAPGITSGFNLVTRALCENGSGIEGASFLSPYPGWSEVMSGAFDGDFAEAAALHAPSSNTADKGGDILLGVWGLMKTVHHILEAAGPDPSRERIVDLLASGHGHETGVFPPFHSSADDHFASDAMHRLEADCTDGLLHQRDAFVTGY